MKSILQLFHLQSSLERVRRVDARVGRLTRGEAAQERAVLLLRARLWLVVRPYAARPLDVIGRLGGAHVKVPLGHQRLRGRHEVRRQPVEAR